VKRQLLIASVFAAPLFCSALAAFAQTPTSASRLALTRPATVSTAARPATTATVQRPLMPTPPPRLTLAEYAQMQPQLTRDFNLKSFPRLQIAGNLDNPGNIVSVGLTNESAGIVILSPSLTSTSWAGSVVGSAVGSSVFVLTSPSQQQFTNGLSFSSNGPVVQVGTNGSPAGSYLITCYIQPTGWGQVMAPSAINYQVCQSDNGTCPTSSSPDSGSMSIGLNTQNINVEYSQSTQGRIWMELGAPANAASVFIFSSCDFARFS
jgi:hypothetical protein